MTEIYAKHGRVEVRPYALSDAQAWLTANKDVLPLQNKFDLPSRAQEELSEAFFAQILDAQKADRELGEQFNLGIFCPVTGSLLGTASLMDIKRGVVFNGILGYRIFNQQWGKGYAADALNCLIEIAFGCMGLHRVEAGIEPDNFRSIRVAEKAGLRLEGLKKKLLWLREDWRDCLIYALTSEEKGIVHPGFVKTGKPNLRF